MSSPSFFALLAALLTVVTAASAESTPAQPSQPAQIRALTPDQIVWTTTKSFTDGRERVDLFGDPSKGGDWIYRVRVPRPIRVEPHTHPVDEHITILEGTWHLGSGSSFLEADLRPYAAGSFVVIPAGTPHFVATGEGQVVIQSSGTGVFTTQFITRPAAP